MEITVLTVMLLKGRTHYLCCSRLGVSLKQVWFGYCGKKTPRYFQPMRLM